MLPLLVCFVDVLLPLLFFRDVLVVAIALHHHGQLSPIFCVLLYVFFPCRVVLEATTLNADFYVSTVPLFLKLFHVSTLVRRNFPVQWAGRPDDVRVDGQADGKDNCPGG